MMNSNITPGLPADRRGVSKATRAIGALCTSLAVATALLAAPVTHAAQSGWPPVASSQSSQPKAPAWFPFAAPVPQQPARQTTPGFPFPWMGGSGFGTGTTTPQWNTYSTPTMPFGTQSGFSPFSNPMMGNPMMGFGGFGNMGNMGMMMGPMMGFMAPMMTNYAMASLNPTTMTNFFGMMTNPGGGMMPFGGFGFPGGGFGAPTNPFQYQNRGSTFPWSPNQTTPWSQPAVPKPFGGASTKAPAFPPFFPFFHQGGTGR